MLKKRTRLGVHKVRGTHPVTSEPIDLKWYRGASRYNNGATLYGDKYKLRYLIAYNKVKPYTAQEFVEYKLKQ